ncbi:MAG: GHKL domain-containing protein, partial [Paucibacter sp.]|nr:GHKL domain-containing protein [Roseateles sp.]
APPVAVDWRWREALPGPAWVVAGDALKDEARILALNPQACALSCAEVSIGSRWADCMGRLPEPVAAALAAQTARSFAHDGDSFQLLTLWPQAALPAGERRAEVSVSLPQTQQMAHEHESFSYTVSHDLRAPLRVVEGFTRILKEDYGRLLDRIGNDHLDRVMGAAARMNSMIDSLLSLAQLSAQPLARQPVNLSQLAGFVVEELARATPERNVNVYIQAHMLVQGDPTLLRMVLENLLGNAWKYSSKCAQPLIRFEAQQEAGQWIYRVSDNGAGFDMRFADRLFGVFQRLHSASEFQGTGVGLASVRRIVRRHGGEIWAEAVVGEGAQFYFTLAG